MPRSEKYVPTHRNAPGSSAVLTGVRNTVVLSGVAVAATGIAVTSGVLSDAAPAVTSPMALTTGLNTHDALTAAQLNARTESVSRSSDDRRAVADAVKQQVLSNESGVAKTKKEDLSDADPRTIAKALMPEYGLSSDEFDCLDRIWSQESGWNVHADNPNSSAYGIPQALPGSKMSSAGSDWSSSAETQIRWGLGYIKDRYGTACSAWSYKSGHGSY